MRSALNTSAPNMAGAAPAARPAQPRLIEAGSWAPLRGSLSDATGHRRVVQAIGKALRHQGAVNVDVVERVPSGQVHGIAVAPAPVPPLVPNTSPWMAASGVA